MADSPRVAGEKGVIDDMSTKEAASKYSSAAAFVESGVQEVYEDACSICLETFTVEEPCTKTSCNHDYHLQCILEWSQRSAECPMCWQALSLQDPESQELLAACAQERAFAHPASPSSFLQSPLEEFEFHHRFSSSYPDEGDVERRIMQHLAAAAAGMSRARFLTTSSRHGAREATPPGGNSPLASSVPSGNSFTRRFSSPATPEMGTLVVGGDTSGRSGSSSSPSALSNALRNTGGLPGGNSAASAAGDSPEIGSSNASPPAPSTPPNGLGTPGSQTGSLSSSPRHAASFLTSGRLAGRGSGSEGGSEKPSALGNSGHSRSGSASSQEGSPLRGGEARLTSSEGSGDMAASLGDAFKSRWAAASSRYRDTWSKGTRTFREKLRLRSGAVADLSAKAREVGAGVVRAFERMSDPGASSSERPDHDGEHHPSDPASHPPGSTSSRGGPSASSRSSHSNSDPEEYPQSSTVTTPAGTSNASRSIVGNSKTEGNESDAIRAGSVTTGSRSPSHTADERVEGPLKGGPEATAGAEERQTAPLTA